MRRRLVVLLGLVALLWALVPASLVSGYQVQGGTPTTGCITTPHVLWSGSVQGYKGFDIQFRLQFAGLGLVMIRPEFSNGQLGPGRWYRGDATVDGDYWEAFRVVLPGDSGPASTTYKSVAVAPGSSGTLRWIATPVVNGSYPGCFVISSVAVRSYVVTSGGGATPPPSGGGMATPAPTPSPDPSASASPEPTRQPNGEPPPGYCDLYGPPPPGSTDAGFVPCETPAPTPTPTPSPSPPPPLTSNDVVLRQCYPGTGAADGHVCGIYASYGYLFDLYGTGQPPGSFADAHLGTATGWGSAFSMTGGDVLKLTVVDSWTFTWAGQTSDGGRISLGMPGSWGFQTIYAGTWPADGTVWSFTVPAGAGCGSGNECTLYYDQGNANAADAGVVVRVALWPGGVEPSPSPSPSTSPTPSPTASPTPSPPPGWATPTPATGVNDPNGDGWTSMAYDGGNSPGAAGGGFGPGSASGVSECEGTGYTPVENKPGYVAVAPMETSPDLSMSIASSGAIIPINWILGGIRWAGEGGTTAVENAAKVPFMVWNQGVDAFVPGECVGAIVTRGTADLMLLEPFATYVEVDASVRAAMSGAAGAPPTFCIPLPGGGEACLPLAEWAATIAPARAVSSVLVWVVALLGVLNVIQRSFKVAAAGVRAGDSAEIMDRRIY